jgi:hypothetical protein
MSQAMVEPAGRPQQQPKRVKLGEELPIFCERCGYSLHGATQLRCDHCTLLHFQCAECGHRQHINTLRPAVARWLGRMRAATLGFAVFFKLNYFGWLLFAWGVMGYEVLSHVFWSPARREMEFEVVVAIVCFGLGFGLFGRMLLLKWKRSWAIGVALATLAAVATVLGGAVRYWELKDRYRYSTTGRVADHVRWAWETPLEMAGLTSLGVSMGVLVAWPVWVGLVRMFLPRRASDALLEWQRGQPPDALGVR